MLWPNGTTTRPRVSSPFGPRKGGASSFHYGADLIGFTVVHAIAAGRVTYAGLLNDAAGYTLSIDHGGGISSRYMHNDAHYVSSREYVAEGQAIALMGDSGNASGKCCHLEIRVKGVTLDPLPYITARLTSSGSGAGKDDDMSAEAELAIFQIRDYLGANGGLNTETPATVGYRVRDIQLALTAALPVLLTSANSNDPAAIASAVVAAIPDDIAQDVLDGLARRLAQ